MTDTSLQTTDIAPMAIGPAIEAMKVIVPYASVIIRAQTVGDAIQDLLGAMRNEQPTDALRLLALMYGKSVIEIADFFERKSGGDLVAFMAVGFEANPLPDLINAANVLGLTPIRWFDG